MWISAHTEHLGIHYKYTGKYCISNTLVSMALLQCVVGGEHLGIGVKICARWEFHQQLPSSLRTHTDAKLPAIPQISYIFVHIFLVLLLVFIYIANEVLKVALY